SSTGCTTRVVRYVESIRLREPCERRGRFPVVAVLALFLVVSCSCTVSNVSRPGPTSSAPSAATSPVVQKPSSAPTPSKSPTPTTIFSFGGGVHLHMESSDSGWAWDCTHVWHTANAGASWTDVTPKKSRCGGVAAAFRHHQMWV